MGDVTALSSLNRVVYIKAYFKAIGRDVEELVPTGEQKKGLFGGPVMVKKTVFQQTGWSDREIDGSRLSDDIASAVQELNAEGFEIASVTPVISGNYFFKYESNPISSSKHMFSDAVEVGGGGSYGYGYGYSFTEGVTIIARRITT